MAITFSDAFLRNMLCWFVPACLFEYNPTSFQVHLYTNNFVPSDDVLLTDFTEANFCGYAPQPLTFPGPLPLEDEPDRDWFTTANPVQFCRNCEADMAHPAQTVYGYYVTFLAHDSSVVGIFADNVWPEGVVFEHACDCLKLTIMVRDKDLTPGE